MKKSFCPLVPPPLFDHFLQTGVTDQEVHASAERPGDEYDRDHLGDTDAVVALDDGQQLQQLVSVEQVDQPKEPQA